MGAGNRPYVTFPPKHLHTYEMGFSALPGDRGNVYPLYNRYDYTYYVTNI